MLVSAAGDARVPDEGLHASCGSYLRKSPLFSSSSKIHRPGSHAHARGPPGRRYQAGGSIIANGNGHGGARANSGGARENAGGARRNSGGARLNSGGARAGAGRPCTITPPSTDGLRWYVVRAVHRLGEDSQVGFRFAEAQRKAFEDSGDPIARATPTALAEFEIREAGFEILTAKLYRPAVRAHRTPAGKYVRSREERFDSLFVRYVIVRLDLADPRWHLIPAMDSVERIICGGHVVNNGVGIPIPVADRAIEWLCAKLSPEGVFYPPGYRAPRDREQPIDAGTALRLVDGPLLDRAGICEMSDGERVVMLMGWFNRDNVPTKMRQSVVEVIGEASAI
jgi:transcription antitermination factor NusG